MPIRYGRMAATPFAYYRGAALPMAADLSTGPRTELDVQLCGDARLCNFGGFASPERTCSSMSTTSTRHHRDPSNGISSDWAPAWKLPPVAGLPGQDWSKLVTGSMRAYREAMHEFATMSNLEVWYSRLDMAGLALVGLRSQQHRAAGFRKTASKAQSRDQLKARVKLTQMVDGELRFQQYDPLVRLSELSGDPTLGRSRT